MWFNPLVAWLLKSPLHRLVDRSLVLLTFTGRKSGRSISTPVNYLRDGDDLWVVSWRERTWWRNLRANPAVSLLLQGNTVQGRAEVIEERDRTARSLADFYRKSPGYARYVGIAVVDGEPLPADCERAAQKLILVKIGVRADSMS